MYSLTGQAKIAEMIDIRRRVDDHGESGDCDGVHQRICSLGELYGQATGDAVVILTCWKCGHEAELEDIERALERALFSMADEMQNIQRALKEVRIRNQAELLRNVIKAEYALDGNTLERIAESLARRHMNTAKRLAEMSIVD